MVKEFLDLPQWVFFTMIWDIQRVLNSKEPPEVFVPVCCVWSKEPTYEIIAVEDILFL